MSFLVLTAVEPDALKYIHRNDKQKKNFTKPREDYKHKILFQDVKSKKKTKTLKPIELQAVYNY